MLLAPLTRSQASTSIWPPRLVGRPSVDQQLGRADAGRPHAQVGAVGVAARRRCTRPCSIAVTLQSVTTSMARCCSSAQRGVGHPFRQRRQDARRAFEQGDADVAQRLQVLEAVAGVDPARLAQLGRQLDPGGAAADDDDVDRRVGLPSLLVLVGHRQQAQQLQAEALGVFGGVQARSCVRRAPGTPK